MDWAPTKSFGVVTLMGLVTLLWAWAAGDLNNIDPAAGLVIIAGLAIAAWYGVMDVRHGPNWLASKRWSRWRWVNLDELVSVDVRKGGWLSSARYTRGAWKVRLTDRSGRTVDVPSLAFRDEELTLQTNVALRNAGLPTIGDLDVLPRGWSSDGM